MVILEDVLAACLGWDRSQCKPDSRFLLVPHHKIKIFAPSYYFDQILKYFSAFMFTWEWDYVIVLQTAS